MTVQARGHLTLSQFLKAKRAAISPKDVGLASAMRFRRVPGLRREEVAQLAGVSVDYYTRLEQGRMIHASDSVLSNIARALMLSPTEREYLYSIARTPSAHKPASREKAVSPETQLLLDSINHIPAFILGRRTDVLAWNALGTALFTDFSTIKPEHRNLARMMFLEPRMRQLYTNWEDMASGFVARLRMDVTLYPDDPRLDALVEELTRLDADFRRWWNQHDVRTTTSGHKRMNHPIVGELIVDWQVLQVLSAPEQIIVTYTAPPGSITWKRFETLAKWWATQTAADHQDESAQAAKIVS
ncbi:MULTISPECIES: helix-turn-helix transcriptional regulator [unclassified Frankia]|uniref:helix-turn-helix transcriptional regulator n=1 Tax=unclassified Frankia TaxID=2632575 RepID=UPI001EF5BDD0|nr:MULTISPECIES: helix-turn-helix transcriptional regulator [unclassified Frankia]